MLGTASSRGLATLLAGSLCAAGTASAQSVYAHYMIGSITEGSGHAELDIDQALALGIDAFALNLGTPDADWAQSAIRQLFDHADTTDFKLFFSLDFYQEADVNAYTDILNDYTTRSSYLTAGPDNYPVVSTFSVGQVGVDGFKTWKQDVFGGEVYFLPSPDDADGYHSDPGSWLQTWGDVVDGVFTWESGWPSGGSEVANVTDTFDKEVQSAAHDSSKTYMAPLSSLQFKDCCGAHYYRIGEVNLPQRMTQLLSLAPDFVEILTWNDAGESHYIGNNWPEGLTEDMLAYSNTDDWPHFAWQPLIASFITAYKQGGDPSSMTPPKDGDEVVGAMWYRTILKDADCNKPDNWESAVDAVNWAVVVDSGVTDLSVRVTSGDEVIGQASLVPGLNYASVPGIKTGSQKVEVVRGEDVVMTAASVKDVTATSDDCFFNFQVAPLK